MTSVSTAYGTTSYEYDKLDRLVRVVDRNGYATVYEYDANGNHSAVKYANGIVVSYDYDEVNRLILEKALDKQGGLVAQNKYTLGAAGERTAVKELDRTVEYTYDALYRLTSEKIAAADGTVTAYTYAYDKVSNRILKTENGAETVYTYNALNQLTAENDITYEYDAAGNLISAVSPTKSTLYVYNAENKLIRATVQEGDEVAKVLVDKGDDAVKAVSALDAEQATRLIGMSSASGCRTGWVVFPNDPNSFNPAGLTKSGPYNTNNGKIIKWLDSSNKAVYEWDEDLTYGAHYHVIGEDGNTRIPNEKGETHFYPGEIFEWRE